jgi:protein-tyrosine phosphatase
LSTLVGVPAPLHLDWPDCLNARDLGGMPVEGGGTIRERALVRSDAHNYLTEAGVAAVRAYGLSRVVDLRRPAECTLWPSPLAADTAYLNLPVQGTDDPETEPTLAGLYCAMLDRRPELFAAVLAAIAEAPDGPVAVHCAAGKDRTGIVVALALSVAGVPDVVIAADYAVTEDRMRPRYESLIAGAADEDEREYWRAIKRAVPDNITTVLRHLRDRYGSIPDYLTTGGFTEAERADLLARLVTADSRSPAAPRG